MRGSSSHNQLSLYRPYLKQSEFHALGARHREVLLAAGNQFGKTLCAAMEVAMHATGAYPPWWQGRRFIKPIVAWCAGVTGEQTRDAVQRRLLGRSGQIGTGALPKARIENWTAARGVSGLADTILVRHVSGGISQIALKTYARGREPWQGESCDLVWFDEEPPVDIYLEGLTRTNATGGFVLMTFTPLLGCRRSCGGSCSRTARTALTSE